MRRPALLLPGPLHAVVKAQRIVLKEGGTYQEVWHQEGFRECVVAVVLYFYGASRILTGGDIEIASTLQTACVSDEFVRFEPADHAQEKIRLAPRMKIPVSKGTLLVFGNYSAVHRVLPMKAVGGSGSREFLALFVIDQRSPLPMYRDLGPLGVRKQRSSLLKEHLWPRVKFGVDGTDVYWPTMTGFGYCLDIAWVNAEYEFAIEEWPKYAHSDLVKFCARVSQMDMTTPVLGRGNSFLEHCGCDDVAYNADGK